MNSRNLRNAERPLTLDGVMSSAALISLPGPQALLVHQLFNESINGIQGIQFETQIGMPELELQAIFNEFNVWVEAQEYDQNEVIVIWDEKGLPKSSFERTYSTRELRSLRNMTEIVMLDLGPSEFQTRTGFELTEAKRLLDELNTALLESLHLDEESSPVAH